MILFYVKNILKLHLRCKIKISNLNFLVIRQDVIIDLT